VDEQDIERQRDAEIRVSAGVSRGCAHNMERKLIVFSHGYGKALEKYLRLRSPASLEQAAGLGRRALALGVDTLELAGIHQRAFAARPKPITPELRQRASVFFTRAIQPIEEIHLAALSSRVPLNGLNKTLRQYIVELASTRRQLKQKIVKRKAVEETLIKSGEHQAQLLQVALQRQRRLRHLTHQLLGAQETEREQISHGLCDEIAQTLLGINVRLLSLATDSRATPKGLQREINNTQKLVEKSARAMHRIVSGFKQDS